MSTFSAYVGLDVHKNSISVAFAANDDSPPRSLGRLPNDLTRLLRKLEPLGSPGGVRVCYEAGPTGYGLVRRLRELGYDCQVVAPAKTPRVASDRVKTDRRDAIKLADFLRSGHLTFIRVPTPEEEALRDLIRTREDIKIKETNSKRQLNSMMLRHGRMFRAGKSLWTKKHFDWIEAQEFGLAWKTQQRLHRRLRAFHYRGMSSKKALIAVARELACAIWALGQQEELMQGSR